MARKINFHQFLDIYSCFKRKLTYLLKKSFKNQEFLIYVEQFVRAMKKYKKIYEVSKLSSCLIQVNRQIFFWFQTNSFNFEIFFIKQDLISSFCFSSKCILPYKGFRYPYWKTKQKYWVRKSFLELLTHVWPCLMN